MSSQDRGQIIAGSEAEGTIYLQDEECRPFSLSPYSEGKLVFCNCGGIRTEIILVVPGLTPDTGKLPYLINSTQSANADKKWNSADIELKKIDTPAVAQVDTVSVGGADDGFYEIVVNGVTFSFVASGDTANEIALGLIAAINGGSEPVTATPSGDDVVITADVAGVAFVSSLLSNPNSNMSLVNTTANVEEVSSIKVVPLLNKFEIIQRACPPVA